MKATIYTTSEFFGNLVKHEVDLTNAVFEPYAQYKESLRLVFIPKGKRKALQIRKTYNPFVLVIKGHGHPNPEELMKVIKETEDCKISQSKYASFDERFAQEADELLASIITPQNLLIDVRHTQGTKIINLS